MDKKIDVLYVVGNGSVNNNAELKYSLRCLSRHAKNLGRVVVCGKIPSFVGGFAQCVPMDDISVSGKHWNMLAKILHGIRTAKLTEPFLFSADDHFITKDVNLCEWPTFTSGDIYDDETYQNIHGKPCGKYQRSICATRRLLEHNGYPIDNCVWHGNMWIDPNYADEVDKVAHSDMTGSIYGYEPMLLFHNIGNSDRHPVRLMSDVKAQTFDEAMHHSQTKGVFSTSDKAWDNGRLLAWFKKNYCELSEFEK